MLFLLSAFDSSFRLFSLLYRIVPSLTHQQHLLTIRNKSDANNSKRRMSIDSPSLSHTLRCRCVCNSLRLFRSLVKLLHVHVAVAVPVVFLIILRSRFLCAWLLMIWKIIRWVLIYIFHAFISVTCWLGLEASIHRWVVFHNSENPPETKLLFFHCGTLFYSIMNLKLMKEEFFIYFSYF